MEELTLLRIYVVLLCLYIFYVTNPQKDTISVYERCLLFNPELENKSIYVNGLAIGDKYFCVWTEDRNMEDISETILHEWLHISINRMNATEKNNTISHFFE